MTDPERLKARAEMAKYRDQVRAEVATWPPLTQEQKDKLAVILRRPRQSA